MKSKIFSIGIMLLLSVMGINAQITITTTSLFNGTVGISYSQTLAAISAARIIWSNMGALPDGLTLNANTGEISGTPTTTGIFNFTVTAADLGGNSDTKPLSITIQPIFWDISAPTFNVAAIFDGSTLTIGGTGAMRNLSGHGAPWYSVRDGITTLIINPGVTNIGNDAFLELYNITGSVDIPNTVTVIGDSAFQFCTKITSFTISNSITSIGYRAFCQCYALTSVTIPGLVTSIGGSAFGADAGLTSITCLNPAPPALGDINVFYGVDKTTCVLNVPVGSVSLYQSADQWKDFTHINGVTTGIESVEAPDVNVYSKAGNLIVDSKTLAIKTVSIYDVSGRLLKTVEAGSNQVSIPQSFNPSVLIVKVLMTNGTIATRKIPYSQNIHGFI